MCECPPADEVARGFVGILDRTTRGTRAWCARFASDLGRHSGDVLAIARDPATRPRRRSSKGRERYSYIGLVDHAHGDRDTAPIIPTWLARSATSASSTWSVATTRPLLNARTLARTMQSPEPMMKKILSLCVITFAVVGLGAGCRTRASVKTANHGVGVGAGAH